MEEDNSWREPSQQEVQSSLEICSSPQTKRVKLDDELCKNNLDDGKSKSEESSSTESSKDKKEIIVQSEKTVTDQSSGGMYNLRTKKTPTKTKSSASGQQRNELTTEIENEIDAILEEKAWKNNLTAVNVKNILRHVITNEHVLAMVRNTMREGNESLTSNSAEEAVYEPKLTRSKAKELMEKQENVPWPISPIKKPQSSCGLMDREYSEDESSSDEEYKPEQESDLDKSTTSVAEVTETPQEKKECNEQNDLEQNEILNLLETENCTEELDSPDIIALRTRSKLPLTDTPLESIAATYVPPDIPPDMTCDMFDEAENDPDWMEFLKDFQLLQPQTPTDVNTHDDDVDDPEYNFFEEDEELDSEDLRDDRAVKITKKEVTELVAEIVEMQMDELDEDDEETDAADKSFRSSDALSVVTEILSDQSGQRGIKIDSCVPLFGETEKLQLEEQMRKHVQLLVQGFILCSSVDELENLKEEYRSLLIELQTFAVKNTISFGKESAFKACNLSEGVELVTKYTDTSLSPRKLNNAPKKKSRALTGYGLTLKAKETIAESKIFIYPDLLPVCGFPIQNNTKVAFSETEDLLIALGLEQFYPLKKSECYIKLIKQHLLPTKTEEKIKVRIKNLKATKAPNNPVKYYFQHKKLAEIPRQINNFNPNEIKVPINQPSNLVPIWLQKKILGKTPPTPVAIRPAIAKPSTPTISSNILPTVLLPQNNEKVMNVIVVQNSVASSVFPNEGNAVTKTPEKNHGSVVSATTNRVSPLKQISPILKKYSPKRLKKTGGNLRRTLKMIFPKSLMKTGFVSPNKNETNVGRQLAPKPIPPEENEDVSSTTDVDKENENSTRRKEKEEGKSENEQQEKQQQMESMTDQHLSPNNVETDSQSDAEMFDDCEEALDNAEDLAALMAASSTIQTTPRGRHLISGKRSSRQQRDTQATIQLLAHDLLESDPLKDERDTAFAQSYLHRVKEMTKDRDNLYESFIKLLYEFSQSEKSAVYLHREVCKLLKDYPPLCLDFVAFLMPEQALECGKLMEYLRLRQMRTFLRKIEIHFQQHPQHIHKLVKAFSQCQEQIHLGINHIKNIVQPLFRGRAHLMEEFLQLFPTESVPDSMITDFEEVTLPDSDTEVDEDGFEVVTLPEDKYEFGGKNCQCQCHFQTDDLKLQKRIRHCVPCGTKFVDGRIYIQTGKALRPAHVTYLNVNEKCKSIPTSTTVPETTVDCSECSSVSSLSPTDLKDSEEEKEIGSTNLEKNNLTSPQPNINPPSTVNEETNFTGNGKSIVETPNDFSNLREALNQNKLDENLSKNEASLSAKNHSIDEKGEVVVLWTKDADRLILKTCQHLGPTPIAFQVVSQQLGNKSVDEVGERFSELIRLYSVQRNDASSSDGSEMED